MSEELRTLLVSELNAEQRPPLGDIVAASMRDGRRMRRNRRFASIGAGTAVAAVMAVAVVAGGPLLSGDKSGTENQAASNQSAQQNAASNQAANQAASNQVASNQAAPTVQGATKQARVKATTRGMLELLSQALPGGGKVSAPAAASDGSLAVQLNVDRGQGIGMVRVFVSRGGAATGKVTVRAGAEPTNCIQSRFVTADWAGGAQVMVLVPTCLAWDGTQNKPSPSVLSVAEAKTLAADDRWGPTMDKALVTAGAVHFPTLTSFS